MRLDYYDINISYLPQMYTNLLTALHPHMGGGDTKIQLSTIALISCKFHTADPKTWCLFTDVLVLYLKVVITRENWDQINTL